MTIYRLIQLVDGEWITNDFTEANVMAAMSVRGFEFTGPCKRKQLRPELQGQPMFAGVLGPMWGGEEIGGPVVRYEDQTAYDRLST
jgi:hypothetical protein